MATSAAASAATSWRQQWHPGRRVQEASPPGRKGTIRAVAGTGQNARITVGLDGRPPATFIPAQLILI